ncbi:hypothetical protein L9F63_012417, partial [Diploptera punctata]
NCSNKNFTQLEDITQLHITNNNSQDVYSCTVFEKQMNLKSLRLDDNSISNVSS